MRMADKRGIAEARKRVVAEQLWLHYYNRVLYDKGVISEDERNRMANRIDAGRPVTPGSMAGPN